MAPKIRLAPKFPEIKLPDAGRRPQIAIALERFRSEVPWADTHDGRAIIRILEPVALKAVRRKRAILARKIDQPQAFALPKEATPQALRAEVREKLDEISHKIAFALTPGIDLETKVGPCFTCGTVTVLQWGHFISQADCPWLVYHQHNTRGQCGRCNGFGQGQYGPFRAHLERQVPGMAAKLEKILEQKGQKHPRIAEYEGMLLALEKFAKERGFEIAGKDIEE